MAKKKGTMVTKDIRIYWIARVKSEFRRLKTAVKEDVVLATKEEVTDLLKKTGINDTYKEILKCEEKLNELLTRRYNLTVECRKHFSFSTGQPLAYPRTRPQMQEEIDARTRRLKDQVKTNKRIASRVAQAEELQKIEEEILDKIHLATTIEEIASTIKGIAEISLSDPKDTSSTEKQERPEDTTKTTAFKRLIGSKK